MDGQRQLAAEEQEGADVAGARRGRCGEGQQRAQWCTGVVTDEARGHEEPSKDGRRLGSQRCGPLWGEP